MGNISRIKGSNQVRVKYYVILLYALVQAFAKEKKTYNNNIVFWNVSCFFFIAAKVN